MFQHYVSQIPMCTFEKAKTQALNGTLDGAQTSSTRCTSDGRRGRLKVSMDMWIKRTVSALAEPHPRKNELHMDKVAPKDVLRMFKDDCKYGAMQVFNLYKGKSARGRDKFDFHPSTFRKRWAFRLTKGLPKVYLRLHKGVSSKCYSCSRFNRRKSIKVARTRADREYWEEQKRLHLKFVYEKAGALQRDLLFRLVGSQVVGCHNRRVGRLQDGDSFVRLSARGTWVVVHSCSLSFFVACS
jgi:hypothetical protein